MTELYIPKRLQRLLLLVFSGVVLFTLLSYRKITTPNSIIHLDTFDDDIQEFDKKSLKYIYAQSIVQNYNSMMIENPDIVDWTRLAYVFYATDPDRLIPIIINVTQLRKFGTNAQINVICSFKLEDNDLELNKRMKVLEQDNVQITYVKPIVSKFKKDQKYWRDSFTKLYAFNLIQYDRVIYMDADSIILRLMDHLFFIPPALLASTINYLEFKDLPLIINDNEESIDSPPTPLEYVLAVNDLYKKLIVEEYNFDINYYWKFYNELPSMEFSVDSLNNLRLASYFMVIQPNKLVFEWLLKAIENKKPEEYDMEIINNVWKLSDVINKNVFVTGETSNSNNWLKNDKIPALIILPHNPYGLVSGEFRHNLNQHSAYLTTPNDFPYLRGKQISLSIRKIINEIDYLNIEDTMDKFLGVGYWDWAWRFYDKEFIEGKIQWKSDKLKAIYQSEEINFNIDIFGWESKRIYEDAYYIHWSDWPLNKPWMLDNFEDGINSMFTKIGIDSKINCIENVKKIFNEFEKNDNKELQMAIEECNNSYNYWNLIYYDYMKLLDKIKIKINSI